MKTEIKNFFEKIFSQTKHLPIPAGTYKFNSPAEEEKPYRLHLRIEPDGTGILIINASTILHLNNTAAEHAYYLIQGKGQDEAAKAFAERYNIDYKQAAEDFADLKERIEVLISTPDLDPVTFLDFDRVNPHEQKISAPYRLDCALTYKSIESQRMDDEVSHRVKRELLTEEWKAILQNAWNAGIPHIIFTGGEPTLRPDLPELIREAESLGQVTGLITDGLRLSQTAYLHELLQSGLDHLMIILDHKEEQAWEGLNDAFAEDIHITVHITITIQNSNEISAILNRLNKMGVKFVSLSTNTPELKEKLLDARQQAATLGFTLVWDLPVPYAKNNPVAMEQAEDTETISGAGNSWLYVEPDGDVLPEQGMNQVLGNMLTTPWNEIWQKAEPFH